jgi:hypothetical protein
VTATSVRALTLLLLGVCLCPEIAVGQEKQFRVCADPENLPFSNRKMEGFENRIADLIAKDFGATVTYIWWGQR